MSSNKKSDADVYKIMAFPAAFMWIMSILNNEETGVIYFFGVILVLCVIAYFIKR